MKYTVILIFGLFVFPLWGQEEYKQQISIQHDNDFIFNIDRYYTAGTFVVYSTLIEKDFIFKRDTVNAIQLDFTLGQETYTPRMLFTSNFELLGRPYAGYLFLQGQTSQVKNTHLWALSGEIGLTGDLSLARGFQVAYHKLINEFIPIWEGQIANGFHINLKGTYIKDFKSENGSAFSLKSSTVAGTRAVFAKQEAFLFLGHRATLGKSSAFGRLSDVKELYGFLSLGTTWVIHNSVIEGHLFGDQSPFTLRNVPFLFNFQAGVTYRGKRNLFQAIYNFQTRETFREGRSQYAALKIARRF